MACATANRLRAPPRDFAYFSSIKERETKAPRAHTIRNLSAGCRLKFRKNELKIKNYCMICTSKFAPCCNTLPYCVDFYDKICKLEKLQVPPVCQRRSTAAATRRNALKIKSCHSIPFRPLDCDLVKRKRGREGEGEIDPLSFLFMPCCRFDTHLVYLSYFVRGVPPLSLCDRPWQVVWIGEQSF